MFMDNAGRVCTVQGVIDVLDAPSGLLFALMVGNVSIKMIYSSNEKY